MSRTSPSGPVSVTDELRNLAELSAASNPPGNYYTIPIALAVAFSVVAPPVNDNNTFQFSEFLGPETRAGRVGKTRVTLLADPATLGSDPLVLQWTVNGIPVGTPVSIPWIIPPAFTTLAEGLAFLSGSPVDFPGAAWQPGDFVLLQVTVGAIVGGANGLLGITYEKNYAP